MSPAWAAAMSLARVLSEELEFPRRAREALTSSRRASLICYSHKDEEYEELMCKSLHFKSEGTYPVKLVELGVGGLEEIKEPLLGSGIVRVLKGVLGSGGQVLPELLNVGNSGQDLGLSLGVLKGVGNSPGVGEDVVRSRVENLVGSGQSLGALVGYGSLNVHQGLAHPDAVLGKGAHQVGLIFGRSLQEKKRKREKGERALIAWNLNHSKGRG